MRVGIFNPYQFSKYHSGGTEKMVDLLVKELDKRGIECKIFPQGLESYSSLYNPLFRSKILKAAKLQMSEFDIIHSHRPEIGFEIFDQNTLLTTFHTLKSSYANVLPLSPQKILAKTLGERYDRKSFQKSKVAVAVSDSIAKEMKKIFGNGKIITVHNGIDLSRIKEIEKKISPDEELLDKPDIFFIGRLVKQKSADTLLKALGELKRRGISRNLIIAGDGEERHALENLAHSLGIRDQVRFSGRISEELKFAYFTQAKLVVFTSSYEAGPIAIMEAMAVGANIICSDIPPFKEIGEKTVDYFALGDSVQLANLIAKNDEKDTKKSMEAKEISQKYDFTITANEYIKLYKSIP